MEDVPVIEGREDAAERLRRLWAEQRDTCGWFVREDFVPRTREECRLALHWLKSYGDRDTWAAARRLEKWL